MACIGIDVGNSTSKIGAARRSGIDVLLNSASSRATPSLISFGQKARALGEAAATAQVSNFKNTVGSLKRLIGRSLQDADIQEIEKKYLGCELVDVNGEVGAKVRLGGEEQIFSATQMMGMYLGSLRDTASRESGGAVVSDVVISTPSWFTDIQRKAMLEAAEIAGLNTLRLINDTTATALGYGITKSDLPEADEPRHVVFCDIGHSSYQVAVVAFVKGQLNVLGTAQDRHFGGRDFDMALLQHFATEFKQKYKLDILSNAKATFRLATACERLKKVLSANAVAPINVESLMNDVDASGQLKREEFEELIAPLLDRVTAPLEAALSQSGLTKDQIHSIEMVGGSSRVPALKERISSFFGKPLSFTSNQDEAVCRGCTLACASLSPVFRVREFTVHDTTPYPIKVTWEPAPDVPDEETELVVFQPNNPIPSTKILTFYRKEPFSLEAFYAQPEQLPKGIKPWLGTVQIKGVTPSPQGDHSIVKVKARLNLHGILNVESAYVVEEVEKDVPVASDPAAMETDKDAPPKTEKKKVLQRKNDLTVISALNAKDPSIMRDMKEKEGQLYAQDKLVTDTENAKNALEEYIYDQRSKLDDRHKAYVTSEEKDKFLQDLNAAEEWLYSEEGEDATKSSYSEKLSALQKLGNPIIHRYAENDARPKAAAQLREALNTYMSAVNGGEEKYSHLTEEDKQKVIEKCATVESWLSNNLAKQAELPKNVNPKISSAEILKNKDEVQYVCGPIVNKPKPRVPPQTSGTQTPQSEQKDAPKEADKEDQEAAAKADGEGPGQMDVD
ncbi:putative heat shock protein Hsp88 [Tilletiaria anomala UBC 951]|uniref:Putative heat shock protein Hsp88 n=1 Tax=Tilletiaria anomala (strain ATCC 24038 / CBS 436.72 / UBC 951) TaxID=1037660 RepID=A0A066VSX1_TILAU|nr:putative heat shock protein Hsp88 [Tilletiaria anomala UBC 951]KDN44571.1 putative heat shock protein Hsp88 [Tilletiaria anomala UBC 951]